MPFYVHSAPTYAIFPVMNFIELLKYPEKPEPFIPNKINVFPHCRYCGNLRREELRYERGLMGDAKYDCRDSKACGGRIRKDQPLSEVDQECPF